MNSSRFTFRKEERLSKKKLIDELFEYGSSFYFSPFRIITLSKSNVSSSGVRVSSSGVRVSSSGVENRSVTKQHPVQVLISVSKKNFKRAVDRNKIKRLIREGYRLNKYLLYDSVKETNQQLLVVFIYTSKTIESFSFIQEKIISILKKLSAQNAVAEKNPG